MTVPPKQSLFEDSPDEPIEGYLTALIGGTARVPSLAELATIYKRAGDSLVDAARDARAPQQYVYPVLFLYRHALELYLKAIVEPAKPTHNLERLAKCFEDILLTTYRETVPSWFWTCLRDFAHFDPVSDAFRYTLTRRELRTSSSPLDAEASVDFNRL